MLKRLDHPGIVKYLGMQRKRDTLNIALEYVLSLGPLRMRLDSNPPILYTDTSRTVPWGKP